MCVCVLGGGQLIHDQMFLFAVSPLLRFLGHEKAKHHGEEVEECYSLHSSEIRERCVCGGEGPG